MVHNNGTIKQIDVSNPQASLDPLEDMFEYFFSVLCFNHRISYESQIKCAFYIEGPLIDLGMLSSRSESVQSTPGSTNKNILSSYFLISEFTFR